MLRSASWLTAGSTALLFLACSHAWDDLDPRLGAGGGPDAGGTTTSSSVVSSGSSSASVSTTAVSGGGGTTSSANGGGGAGPGGQGGAGPGGSGGQGGQVVGCPANGTDGVQDGFDDGTIDAMWTVGADPGVQIDEIGGELVIHVTPDPNTEIFGAVASSGRVFEDCRIVVHVTEVPTSPAVYGGILALTTGNPGDRFEMGVNNGELQFIYWLNDTPTDVGTAIPYDALAHAWWRMRESSGTTYWETAPDGKAWVTRASIQTPMPTQAMQIALFGGAFLSSGAASETRFDSVNLPPP